MLNEIYQGLSSFVSLIHTSINTTMKRLLLISLILFLSIKASSQVYFTYGYGSNFAKVDGLNQFVDNYNSYRSWLRTEMKPFSYVDGLTATLGVGAGVAWLETEYAFRSQKRFADGIDVFDDDVTREVKLKQGGLAISLGGLFVEDGGGSAFGLRTEFGRQKLLTRLYKTGTDKPDWEKYDLRMLVNTGPVMKIFLDAGEGVLGTITLYYTFGLFKTNVYEIEADVNHSNPPEKDARFQNKNNVFGFNIAFGLYSG